ncbi:DUF262 domain-containing protein [Winogradskyella ouciana]|uniref:DUF262 domain-containing protein n=1 Tax=Winogradskyella ouciana TaxID=2608631 RepID=UPI003D276FFC
MDIKAEVKSISELKDFFFLVPDYQREYVWKPDDQVEQFLIDIDNEFNPDSEEQKSYFIGSIIIVENRGKYDVIDGQQRLTTIVLTLCAFRDILRPLKGELDTIGEEYLKSIEGLLFSFDLKTKKSTYRLELQYEESKDYLNTLILSKEFEEEKSPSIYLMEQAYNRVKSHLELYLKEGLTQLLDYASYFLTHIEIVVIKPENLSSALKIFETINQRGTNLNAMDLVKNLLFIEADEDEFDYIKKTWKKITDNLQSCGEENSPLRFLRYFLMARYHNGIIREDDIYSWIISAEGKKATDYQNNPSAFAKELMKISKRYADLVNATQHKDSEGKYPEVANIGYINKVKSRQHLVLLLALDINTTDEEINYLAKQIESFFFYSNTLGIQAKYNESLFIKWANELRQDKGLTHITNVVENFIVPYIKERTSKIRSEFLNIFHAHYNPLYRLRFIFAKIENTILEQAGLPLQDLKFLDKMQIEHILPQTPKDGILTDEFEDMDDYTDYVYSLGNVILLESQINQAVNNFNDLSSDWFTKKQGEYINSTVTSVKLLNDEFKVGINTALNRFRIDKDFLFTSWDKDAIEKRQKILLDLVYETWKFNNKRIDS